MNTENTRIECPFCAELIKPSAKICRFCGKEITERYLEESGFTKQCPSCYKVLKPNLGNCIYCGVELYVCDDCDSYVLKDDKICSKCGTSFDDEKESRLSKFFNKKPKGKPDRFISDDDGENIEGNSSIQKNETKITIDQGSGCLAGIMEGIGCVVGVIIALIIILLLLLKSCTH